MNEFLWIEALFSIEQLITASTGSRSGQMVNWSVNCGLSQGLGHWISICCWMLAFIEQNEQASLLSLACALNSRAHEWMAPAGHNPPPRPRLPEYASGVNHTHNGKNSYSFAHLTFIQKETNCTLQKDAHPFFYISITSNNRHYYFFLVFIILFISSKILLIYFSCTFCFSLWKFTMCYYE